MRSLRKTSPKSLDRPSPDSHWLGIALSFYAFVAIGISEGGLGVLLPSILQTYHLTTATVSLLFVSQVSGYMIAAFTSSLLSSRLGLARMLLMASVMLTSALSVYAFTSHWWIMVASGMVSGLGSGLIDAGINTYIANNQRNANTMGFLHGFYGIGALLGPTLATTFLALGFEWHQVYFVIASLVSVTIVGMLWAVIHRYPPLTRPVIPTGTRASTHLKAALRTPIVLVAGLMLFIYVGTEVSIGNWAYTVQTASRHIPNWIAGYSVSGYWLGLTIGRFGMGQMIRRFGAVRTIDLSMALLLIGLLLWWRVPSQWISLPLTGFALSAVFPATIWLMPQRVPSALVPAAIGFLSSVASLGAASIPAILGWTATQAGVEIIPALLVPLAIALILLHRWLVQHTANQKP